MAHRGVGFLWIDERRWMGRAQIIRILRPVALKYGSRLLITAGDIAVSHPFCRRFYNTPFHSYLHCSHPNFTNLWLRPFVDVIGLGLFFTLANVGLSLSRLQINKYSIC